jgi:hypothetical protein
MDTFQIPARGFPESTPRIILNTVRYPQLFSGFARANSPSAFRQADGVVFILLPLWTPNVRM